MLDLVVQVVITKLVATFADETGRNVVKIAIMLVRAELLL